MKYKVIENYISPDECKKLIEDASKYVNSNDLFLVAGGRIMLNCTDLQFIELYEKSLTWKKLIDNINSKKFFDYCCKKLDIDNSNFKKISFFTNNKPSKNDRIYKNLNNKNLIVVSSLVLLKYTIMRLLKELKKFIFVNLSFLNKLPIELLYDYSSALNGYERELHRDSDSRLIVFLLYFNKISEDANGGNLDFYKYDNNKNNYPAQPPKDDCTLIDSIKPDSGKLLIFQNSNDSYHAVAKMSNNKISRHFLYGGFTILKGKNPFISNFAKKFKTNFHMYY